MADGNAWEGNAMRDEQEQELVSLSSIYMDEMQVTQVGDQPASFSIHISATEAEGQAEAGASITMVVQYSPAYPMQMPKVRFTERKKMEPEHVEELKEVVDGLLRKGVQENLRASSATGLFFDVVLRIQEFLLECNDPDSLHVQFVKRMEQKKKEEAEEQARKQAQLSDRLQAEVHQRQDSSVRQHYDLLEHEDSVDGLESPTSKRRRARSTLTRSSNSVGGADGSLVTRRPSFAYRMGDLIGRSSSARLYKALNLATHSVMSVLEVQLPVRSLLGTRNATQPPAFGILERHVDRLSLLRHENVATCFGCEVARPAEGGTLFRIFQDYVAGGSLAVLLSDFGAVGGEQLASYTHQIVSAVACLHSNGIAHGAINCSSIMIDSTGRILLVDAGINHALGLSHHVKLPSKEQMYLADLWDIGAAVIAMASGGKVLAFTEGKAKPPKAAAVPPALSTDAQEFIYQCTRGRSSLAGIQDLLAHPFISSLHEEQKSRRASHSRAPVRADSAKSLAASFSAAALLGASGHGVSRYKHEFREVDVIGKGGFGEVVKAQHLLDGLYYAIKRIPLDAASEESQKIFQEVKTLARLNHEHVVRYYQAWTEGAELQESETAKAWEWQDEEEDSEGWETSSAEEDTGIAHEEGGDGSDGSGWGDEGELPPMDDEELFGMFQPALYVDEADEGAGLGNTDYADVDGKREDTASESEEEEEEGSEDGGDFETDPVLDFDKPGTSVLYIQMEYCTTKTLWHHIKEDEVDEDESWRLLRQAVEGLDHIHQQGIIHRDLKPANIFLDKHDNVKIGDFGLATQSGFDLTSGTSVRMAMSDEAQGTALYCAPEQKSSSSYDHKVDIYSLGVILMEMMIRFKTVSERAVTLSGLRDGRLPSGFAQQYPQQAELILWMTAADPKDRPTTSELLLSGHLPHKFEDEMLDRALQSIQKNTTTFKNVVNRLFALPSDQYLPYTYNSRERSHAARGAFNSRIAAITSDIDLETEAIFRLHGAVAIQTPLLMPESEALHGARAVRLMDDTGAVVALPHDLTLPFASMIALNDIEHSRRFVFDSVVSRQSTTAGQPKHSRRCSFDMVGPERLLLQYEAETVVVAHQALAAASKRVGCTYKVYVSHAAIFEAVLELCGVPPSKAEEVQAIMEHGLLVRWATLANRLLALNLPPDAVDKLQKLSNMNCCLSRAGTLWKALKSCGAARVALRRLEELSKLLAALGVRDHVSVCLGVVWKRGYSKGLMLQGLLVGKTYRDVVVTGGDYSHLVGVLQPPNSSVASRAAVGLTFSLSRIYSRAFEAVSKGGRPSSSADVLIVSSPPGTLLQERAGLASSLWAAGIRCIFIEPVLTSDTSLPWHCEAAGIPWLLTVKKDEQDKPRGRRAKQEEKKGPAFAVVVESVLEGSKEEMEMDIDKVTALLKERLREPEEVEEASFGESKSQVPVTVFNSQSHGRSKAMRKMQSDMQRALEPIIASLQGSNLTACCLDVPGEVLRSACATPDFVTGGGRFAAKYRKSLGELREHLAAGNASAMVLLYSSIDGSIHLLQM